MRRAYQQDRANVADEDRIALLLLQDSTESSPARIGLLDVGGATLTTDPELQEKVGRKLQSEVCRILEHPVFKKWLTDKSKPKYFRDAGHFWGIAPGTPANIVRERVGGVDNVLRSAKNLLDERGINEIVALRGGKVLFDRHDIDLCIEFQVSLKGRFVRDLMALDPGFSKQATN